MIEKGQLVEISVRGTTTVSSKGRRQGEGYISLNAESYASIPGMPG